MSFSEERSPHLTCRRTSFSSASLPFLRLLCFCSLAQPGRKLLSSAQLYVISAVHFVNQTEQTAVANDAQ